jgi:autoinducer 2-degrading protein
MLKYKWLEEDRMHIVHVFFKVKEECIERFKRISIENAQNSLEEGGVVRFDVLQQQGSNNQFMFQEIYLSPAEQLKHRATEHFKKWKAEVGDLLSEEYSFIKYDNLFPSDDNFSK